MIKDDTLIDKKELLLKDLKEIELPIQDDAQKDLRFKESHYRNVEYWGLRPDRKFLPLFASFVHDNDISIVLRNPSGTMALQLLAKSPFAYLAVLHNRGLITFSAKDTFGQGNTRKYGKNQLIRMYTVEFNEVSEVRKHVNMDVVKSAYFMRENYSFKRMAAILSGTIRSTIVPPWRAQHGAHRDAMNELALKVFDCFRVVRLTKASQLHTR